MKKIIKWEKWVDPFGGDIDEAKWTDYDNDIIDPQIILDNNLDETDNKEIPIKNKSIRVISSPLGLIPYNEHTASGKIFNFWLGHTNFDITQKVKEIIEKTDGIEILDIFTRYRFRIAIGKCFNDSETMKLITDNLYEIDKQHEHKLH